MEECKVPANERDRPMACDVPILRARLGPELR